jgi:hypothetical protein
MAALDCLCNDSLFGSYNLRYGVVDVVETEWKASVQGGRVPHSFAFFANEWVLGAPVAELLHGTSLDL